jgi:hypothetical protein
MQRNNCASEDPTTATNEVEIGAEQQRRRRQALYTNHGGKEFFIVSKSVISSYEKIICSYCCVEFIILLFAIHTKDGF